MRHFNFSLQLIFLSPTLYLLHVAKNGIGQFKTYFLFVLYYALGYALYLYVMHSTIDQYTVGGWMAIGNFDFSEDQILSLTLASAALMSGLYIGYKIYILFSGSIRNPIIRNVFLREDVLVAKYVVNWTIISAIIIITMLALGIGRTGLQDSTILPFGLKGFLFYARIILIPLIGIYLLELTSCLYSKKLFHRMLLIIPLISLSIGILFFSRSEIVFFMAPVLAYLFLHDNPSIRKESRSFLFKTLLIIVFGTQLVQIGRNFYFDDSSTEVNLSDITTAINSYGITNAIDNLIVLLTVRQGGARDMAVALNSSYDSTVYIWNFFWQIDEEGFMYDVWGFVPEAIEQEGKSYGTGFNGFGWYGFGGNIVIIFLLSIITGWLATWVESLFVKRNLKSAQYFIAFYFTLTLWNSFVWGRAWRIIPMILFAAYIIDKIDSKIYRHRV